MGVFGVLDLTKEEIGRGLAQEFAWLAYRGEWHRCCCRELDVVVADDGQIVRHSNSEGDTLLKQSERQQVVGAEHRSRAVLRAEAENALACPDSL